MGIKYSFVDNAVYGTQDVNDIARSLVGAGVAPFLSKSSYNVSNLNAMTSALVGTGVQLNGCKVIVQNTSSEIMTVTVSQGIIFFESGVRLEVDSAGYVILAQPTISGFVFAHYNPSLQMAEIRFEAQLPNVGETVLLSKIKDGVATDKRTFAQSKVATLGKNVKLNTAFAEIEPELLETTEGEPNSFVIARIPEVDLGKFNYALVYSPGLKGYQMLDLSSNDSVYMQQLYAYGPFNYAKMVDGRLCITQELSSGVETPYVSADMLGAYKTILV